MAVIFQQMHDDILNRREKGKNQPKDGLDSSSTNHKLSTMAFLILSHTSPPLQVEPYILDFYLQIGHS